MRKILTAFSMLVIALILMSFSSCASLADIRSGVVYEYKIGDLGPAGGIIFHMRNDSEGQHYMEAAPVDLPSAEWGLLGIYTDATGTTAGKQNTVRLMEALNRNGESGKAAQLCNEYTLNGYNDWFLPSYDEILYMYNNLRKRGLGGFNNDLYWTSTQGGRTLMGTHNTFAKDFNTSTSPQYLGVFGKDMVCSVRAIRTFTISNNQSQPVNLSVINTERQEEDAQTREPITIDTNTQLNQNEITQTNESNTGIGIYSVVAQDQIFLKNGSMFYATIIEETTSGIRYTYPDRYGDTVFVLHISGIQSIRYENERNLTKNQSNSSRQENQRSSSGRNRQRNSAPELGTPSPIQQIINSMPAIPIPLAGKNFKFELGGDTWIAKVNGENILAGNCMFEETGNGYILKLKTTHVWTGAIENVIDLLQRAGIPLGPAAGPLRTAARLAARVANWIPLDVSSIVLAYNESPANISFLRIEK